MGSSVATTENKVTNPGNKSLGLNKRLTCLCDIQENHQTKTPGFKEATDNWETIQRVWADVSPLSGREYWNATQVQAGTTHKITFRWSSSLQLRATHRLKFGDRLFQFQEPPRNVDERNFFYEVMAFEIPKEMTETESDQGAI